jgi:hypothetical protein
MSKPLTGNFFGDLCFLCRLVNTVMYWLVLCIILVILHLKEACTLFICAIESTILLNMINELLAVKECVCLSL